MHTTDLKFMPEFYDRYIKLVDNRSEITQELKDSANIFESSLGDLIENASYRYKPEKWTPKEMLQHIIDTERILSYRALAISRGETQKIISFDENLYAQNSRANNRSIDSLLLEFKLVRQGTSALFESFDADILHFTGICSNIKISVGALGFVVIGHTIHHLNVLKERYFEKQSNY